MDDLITMLKNLEPLEKREVRGIMIGMRWRRWVARRREEDMPVSE